MLAFSESIIIYDLHGGKRSTKNLVIIDTVGLIVAFKNTYPMLISNQEDVASICKNPRAETMIDTEKYPSQAVLECLLRFFNTPSVKNLSFDKKRSFLRTKGIKENGAFFLTLFFCACIQTPTILQGIYENNRSQYTCISMPPCLI